MISSQNQKNRVKAFSELVQIRNRLRRELVGYRIAQVGIDAPTFPDRLQPKEPSPDPDILSDLPTLFSLIKGKIKTKQDVYGAMGFWSSGNLLGFTLEQRATICKALIEATKEIGIQPKSTWINVIRNPDFFEEWADEVFGRIDGDLLAELNDDGVI